MIHPTDRAAKSPVPYRQMLIDEFRQVHARGPSDSASLQELYDHQKDEDPRTALCLSGGGIRSATFGLGVLQGLARWNALDRFHYLSTVSGGGYIGSWLSRWVQEDGLPEVSRQLAGEVPAFVKSQRDDDPEPAPLRYLRAHGSYLAPRRGLSADTLTLITTYLRNLFLNWLFFVPLLLAVALAPRVFLVLLGVTISVSWAGRVAGLLALAMAVVSVVAAVRRNLPALEPHGRRFTSIRSVVGPLGLGAVLLTLGWAGAAATLRQPVSLAVCMLIGFGVPSGGILLAWGLRSWRRRLVKTGTAPAGDLPAQPTTPWQWVRLSTAAIMGGAAGGLVLWTGARFLFPRPAEFPVAYTVFGVPYLLATYWVGTSIYIAISSSRVAEEDREWWARGAGLCLAIAGGWLGLTGLVLYGPSIVLQAGTYATAVIAGAGGLAGAITTVGGFLARGGLGEASSRSTWTSCVLDRALPVLACVFVACLGLALSFVSLQALQPSLRTHWGAAEKDVDEGRRATSARAHETSQAELQRYREVLRETLGRPTDGEARTGDLSEAMIAVDEVLREERRNLAKTAMAPAAILPLRPRDYLRVVHESSEGVARELLRRPVAWMWVVTAAVAMVVLTAAAAMTLGVNRFSLHSMYANRLIRAYLAASRRARRPDPSTGFDPADNIAMATLRPASRGPQRLFHVVNTALNIGRASRLDWQQRMAAPFSMSTLYAGSRGTGYQPVSTYGGESGLSLGKAMSISGAAVSPAMGYHSSRPVAFVMTLFNVRLGWWLPNPGSSGAAVWGRSEPRFGLSATLAELLGTTSDRTPYVYLSDGGHFDNLGLYEMVARRCRRIVVVDATCDPQYQYEDLARSLRLIRGDLGVDIEFSPESGPAQRRAAATHCTIGRIRYGTVDGDPRRDSSQRDGVLIYIKPVLTGTEPVDVLDYAARRARSGACFPHESTGDQFFTEAQFESYRILGSRSIEELRREFRSLGAVAAPEEGLPADPRGRVAEVGVPGGPATVGAPPPSPANEGRDWPRMRVGSQGLGGGGLGWLGVSAVSAVVAGTVAVTLPEAIRLEAPKQPVAVEVKADGLGRALGLNDADRQLLQSVSLAGVAGKRGDGGIQLHPEDRPLLAGPLTVKVEMPREGIPLKVPTRSEEGLPIRGPVSVELKDKQIGLSPSTLRLENNTVNLTEPDWQRLQGILRDGGVASDANSAVLKDIEKHLASIDAVIKEVNPRRHIKGTKE